MENHCVGESPFFAKTRGVLVPVKDNESHTQHYPGNLDGKLAQDFRCNLAREREQDKTKDQKEQDIPFQDVYANIQTKTVQMTERNAFGGTYHTTVLLKKDDDYRVVGYSGGELVAVGSRERVVRLMDVSSSKEVGPLIRGHAGSIRALLLCEERNLLITASYDLSIRCWNLKTGASMMVLRGHMDTINCLDLHANTLVSGANDCKVKVWDLATGKCFENLRFKHHSPVWCVKTDATLLLSSCAKGLVKMWDTKTASLLKVINAHQSAVKCLFFDSYHIVTGDSDGKVMAWSTNVNVKGCLMTFHHPREVRSVMLSDLCVITGCMDERIRIFSFLRGHCVTAINVESPILSIHIDKNRMMVNTRASVLLYQFDLLANWDTSLTNEPTSQEEKGQTGTPKFNHMAQAGPSILKVCCRKVKKPKKRANTPHHVGPLSAITALPAQAGKYYVTTKVEMTHSDRAVQERLLKNKALPPEASLLKSFSQAPQPPATQDKHLKQPLFGSIKKKSETPKLPALQDKYSMTPASLLQKQCYKTQEFPSMNEKLSAAQQVLSENTKSHVPLLSKSVDLNLRPSLINRGVLSTSHPSTLMQLAARDNYKNYPACSTGKLLPFRKVGPLTTTAMVEPQAPERMFMKALCKHPGRHVRFAMPSPPAAQDSDTEILREQTDFWLLTDTQLKEYVRVLSSSSSDRQDKRSKTAENRQRIRRMKLKGLLTGDYTKKDQVCTPEWGHDTYI
ncbi:F-box/WD repeat-containing protein 10-like [Myripristis murdjan]|uniref:F-box/WD repeat-containing protein 10-like n=1 Tax=Myripristis murdjan TaxID=586833 RepID=UPI0011760A6E|nr:F-box/WD repeat-containing protein 10-like [Myripristis murdjan]